MEEVEEEDCETGRCQDALEGEQILSFGPRR